MGQALCLGTCCAACTRRHRGPYPSRYPALVSPVSSRSQSTLRSFSTHMPKRFLYSLRFHHLWGSTKNKGREARRGETCTSTVPNIIAILWHSPKHFDKVPSYALMDFVTETKHMNISIQATMIEQFEGLQRSNANPTSTRPRLLRLD